MFDLLLKGGRIVDGTGAAWFSGDVAVSDGRIAAMGNLKDAAAKRVIDVSGAAVAPGFIDIHTHSDVSLLVNPRAESKIRQGVTTEVVGNCGSSVAPVTPNIEPGIRRHLAEEDGVELAWNSFGEYLDRLQAAQPAVNVAALIGLGLIRENVVGEEDRDPTPAEVEAMQALIGAAMADGAFGISSGLEYAPSSFADTDELVEMARAAHRYGGFYATHMRDEGDDLVLAVEEAINVGERSGAPVQISHHKAVGPDNWGKVKETLALTLAARRRGVDVTVDQYPYVAVSTSLSIVIPLWAHDGGRDALLARLQDPELRAEIAEEADALCLKRRKGWDKVYLSEIDNPALTHLEGKHVGEAAAILGMRPVDAAIHILRETGGTVGMIGFGMCEEDIRFVMQHPLTMFGSDASARAPYGPLSKGKPHPRAYGTFARILGRYVREQGVLTLEEAVRKMTSLPARRLGLWDRGVLRPGMAADITVFDPDTVLDRAEFANPHQYAAGIPYVIVGGTVVIDGGEHTGAGPGRVLRRGRL